MNPVLSRNAVDGLREQFSGAVVGPDDAGYDEMRSLIGSAPRTDQTGIASWR